MTEVEKKVKIIAALKEQLARVRIYLKTAPPDVTIAQVDLRSAPKGFEHQRIKK